MKYVIEFHNQRGGKLCEGALVVFADDAMIAQRLLQSDLEYIGATVDAIYPHQEPQEESLEEMLPEIFAGSK